jgi:aspartyl-tRNA(Asn)/glutamyl-tRNA(Gln) amidotransferase subunit C
LRVLQCCTPARADDSFRAARHPSGIPGMSLDKATVARVARLARIHVPDADLEQLAGELNQIIGWVEQLAEVDTEGVEPMTSVVAMSLPRRADVVTEGEEAERVLANAPETYDGYFVVPRVVE